MSNTPNTCILLTCLKDRWCIWDGPTDGRLGSLYLFVWCFGPWKYAV